MPKNLQFLKRLSFAWNGITQAFKKESSLRVQGVCAILLFLACLYLQPSTVWCAVFVAMSVLVISLEMVNSAAEAILDKAYPEHDEVVGFVKDCLAGAVLVASIGSLLVFIIFLYSRGIITALW
jgi:diacylglycerol kinase